MQSFRRATGFSSSRLCGTTLRHTSNASVRLHYHPAAIGVFDGGIVPRRINSHVRCLLSPGLINQPEILSLLRPINRDWNRIYRLPCRIVILEPFEQGKTRKDVLKSDARKQTGATIYWYTNDCLNIKNFTNNCLRAIAIFPRLCYNAYGDKAKYVFPRNGR